MDESKRVNAGKYRNKQRYKNKAKVISKEPERLENDKEDNKIIVEESSLFQKRNLESNWYRYEPKQEDDKDSSRDFSVLASAPISLGSYFQFKSDKNIAAAQNIKEIDNALFQLDVNLLNLSIGSIPFNVQCGIDERYFSVSSLVSAAILELYLCIISLKKQQLNIFKKDAQDIYVKYVAYLKCTEDKCHTDPKQVIPSNNNELTVYPTITSDNIIKSGSDDLEQWLEDILDD